MAENPYTELLDDESEQNKPDIDNPYLEIVSDINKAGPATANVHTARTANPDDTAKAIDIAKSTGLPSDTVERNLKELSEREQAKINNEFIKNSPALQRWLAKSENAKVANDDIPFLDRLTKFTSKIGEGGLLADEVKDWWKYLVSAGADAYLVSGADTGIDLGRSVPAGAVQTVGSTFGGAEALNRSFANWTTDMLDMAGLEGLAEFGRTPIPEYLNLINPNWWLRNLERSGDAAAQMLRPPEERRGLHTDIMEGVGQLAVQALSFKGLGSSGSGFTFFLQGADQAEERAIEGGATPDEAYAATVGGGLAVALSERLGIDLLLNRVPPAIKDKFLRTVTDVMLAGGIEAVEEQVEAILNNLVEKGLYNSKAPIWTAPGQEQAAAGGAAAIVRALLHGVTGGRSLRTRQELAEERVDQFKQLQTEVVESKLFTRHKGKFEEFVAEAEKDEVDPNVYIDAREAITYFQNAGEDAAGTFSSLGVTDQVDKALAVGGDLRVPLSKFMSIADTPHYEPLLMDLRTRQGQETLRETQLAGEQQAQAVLTEAERILADQETADEFKASGEQVRTLVSDQLKATQRFDAATSDRYAALHEAFAVTLAEKLGTDPMTAYQRAAGIRIEAADTPTSDEGILDQSDIAGQDEDLPASLRPQNPVLDEELAGDEAVDEEQLPVMLRDDQEPGLDVDVDEDADIALAKDQAGPAEEVDADLPEMLRIQNPLTDEEIAEISIYDQSEFDLVNKDITETDNFKKWAGTDTVIEAYDINDFNFSGKGPFVMRAFHGTTHDFSEFDSSVKGTKKGQFGAVNYFTSDEGDASNNYAGEGPDLTNRIENLKEQLEQEYRDFIDDHGGETDQIADDLAEFINDRFEIDMQPLDLSRIDNELDGDLDPVSIADHVSRRELSGGESTILEVFIKTEKPFIVGTDKSPWLEFIDYEAIQEQAVSEVADNNGISVDEVNENIDDYESEIDEARWQVEANTENPLVEAISTVANRYGVDPAGILDSVIDISLEGDKQSNLEEMLRSSEALAYAEDYDTGELVGYHMLGEIIQELGFDSIVLKNANDRFEGMDMGGNTAHVHIFNENNTNIKSVENLGEFNPSDPNIFNQGPRGQISFQDGEPALIRLFKDADLTTLLHESGHMFFEAYKNILTEPNAPESIVKDMETLLDWFGIDNVDHIQVEQHEQFARGFEAYLFEGNAPSVELQSAFDRFKAWLLQIYKSIKNLDVTLTDSVRDVMDRMLANEENIAEVKKESDLLPMFKSAEAADMTEQEYDSYRKAYAIANNAAQNDADREVMARLKREQTKAWKEEKNKIKDLLLEKFYAEPANQARHYFMRGKLPNGETIEGLDNPKLSKDALVEMYGDDLTAVWRDLPFGRYSVWVKDGGVHPDEMASVFGYSNGDELVRDMAINKGNLEAQAEEEAKFIMRRRYGDPDDPTALAELAIETVQNEERSNFLSVELRSLEKRAGMKNTPRNVINNAAKRIVNETLISDLREGYYLRASNKYARQAIEFAAAGDFKNSADAKRKQLLNQAVYREMAKAKNDVDKKVNYLAKFTRPGTRKNLARDYLDQIDSILEAYDLKKSVTIKEINRRKSLVEWINKEEADGVEVIVPKNLIERANRRSYKDVSYAEFIGLADSVKNIEHIARFKQKLIVSKQKRDFDATVNDLINKAMETNKIKTTKLGLRDNLDYAKMFAKEFAASHVKMEFLLQQLDGNKPNGPWWTTIFQPLAEAEDNELNMSQEAMRNLNAIFEVYGKEGRKDLYKRSLSTEKYLGRNIKKAELISMALNWGNAGNKQALVEGEGWDYKQVEQAFSEFMTEQDWNAVQSTLDLVNSYWPQIAALQKELTGVTPQKVESTPIKTEFGTFPGGYYPLSYDIDRNIKAFKYEEKMTVDEMFGGNFVRPATRQGHTVERVGSGGMAVNLDISVVGTHLMNIVHDLTHRKAIMQADRIFQNKEIAETIIGVSSNEMYRHIRPWLAGIASDRRPFAGWLEKAVGRLRRGATAVNMGWKVTTAIVQPLGYLQSVDILGEKYAMKGLARFYGNPIKAKQVIEEVFTKSTMMRNRSKTFDRDIRDAIRTIKGESFKDKIQRTLFSHIGFMDYSVSIPTWLGAYQKGLDDNLDEQGAIAYADSVVRMSQSAGGAKDLAAIQRGSEYQRAFTMFYSYFSVLHNLIRRRVKVTSDNGFNSANVTRTTMSFLYLIVLPALLSELIIGRGPDEDEEEDPLVWATTSAAAYPFMTMVGVRDFANAISTGYTFQATPILDGAETLFKSGQSVGDAITDITGITEEEFDRQDVKNITMASGYLFSLPSRQLYITSEHLYSVLNDEEEFSLYELLYRNERQ